jgi:hypothetical protein
MTLSLTLYRGRPGFEALRDPWEAFAGRYGSHFVHFPAWYGAELERAGDDGVYFLALRDSRSDLVAVLPLHHGIWSRGPIAVPIIQLYYPSEMGVNDVLSREPLRAHWPWISRFLRRELPFFVFMRWQCVLESGSAVTVARSPGEVRPTHASKYLRFADGWQAFLDGYSANFKSGLGKKLRKIGHLGDLRLRVHSSPSELAESFEVFLQVEDSGWKGQMGTSILRRPSIVKYYRHLLEHFGRLGLCRINLLLLGNTPIAAQFGIEIGDWLYLLKIGFREDYAPYSPGNLMVYKLVQHHCESTSVKAISFVTGVGWIDRWHPSAVRAGVLYKDCGSVLGRVAVRLLRWSVSVREPPAVAAAPPPAGRPFPGQALAQALLDRNAPGETPKLLRKTLQK